MGSRRDRGTRCGENYVRKHILHLNFILPLCRYMPNNMPGTVPPTYSTSLPEDNIHQITRPRKVARLAHSARIPTHQHQVYLPRTSRSISLRPSSSPTLPTSWLTAYKQVRQVKMFKIFFWKSPYEILLTVCNKILLTVCNLPSPNLSADTSLERFFINTHTAF